jgi:hypothetical protein
MHPTSQTPVTVGDYLESSRIVVDPLDFAYFTALPNDQWRYAKSLAERATRALSGSQYEDYMKSHGPVEKAGELVVKSFFDYYLPKRCCDDFLHANPYVPSFAVDGVTIDVHTRMLKPPAEHPGYYPMLHTRKFLLMVPEIGLSRRADIYVFCGYDIRAHDGYAYGWLSSEELGEVPITTQLKHKAKCVSVYRSHPMHTLIDYITN